MRGKALPVPVFNGGIVLNTPPHQVPPNGILAGSNVFVDVDGLLKPRSGYNPLIAIGPGFRIQGGITYEDSRGDVETVVAGLTNWAQFTGATWQDITGTPWSGVEADPARFAAFFQNGAWYALGVNNTNPLTSWTAGQATYTEAATNTFAITSIAGSGTIGTITLANAVTSIAIGDSITITGNSESGYNVTATVVSVSGNTVTFDSTDTNGGTGGTLTDNSILGSFSARDILILSNRVLVFNTVENGTRYDRRVRWSAFNDATRWPQLGFADLADSNDAIVGARKTGRTSCAVYGQQSIWSVQANPSGDDASAFTAEELFAATNYNGAIGTAAIVVAEGYHYYLGTDGRVYQFNGIQPNAISDTIYPFLLKNLNTSTGSRCHSVYLPQKRGILFFWPPSGQSDPFAASYYALDRGVWEPPFAFSEAITASWQTVLQSGLTWATAPGTWAQSTLVWDEITGSQSLGVLIGTDAGQVHIFFSTFTDNNLSIPYFFQSGLYSADQNLCFLLDRVEVYCSPTTSPEYVTVLWNGYGAPNQPTTTVVGVLADISVTSWIEQMVLPGPTNPNNTMRNYLQLSISSDGSNGGFAFNGGNAYLNTESKGDYSYPNQ